MKLRIVIGILISIVILNHCKKAPSPIHQVSTETIIIDENKTANVFFSLTKKIKTRFLVYPRVAVSPLQNQVIVYGISAADNQKNKLVALTYDDQLNLKKEKAFFYGRGPEDVGSNNIISLSKDNIYISENSNRRVAIYDNDWNLQKYVRYGRGVESFELYENGTIYISTYQNHWKKDEFRDVYYWELASFPECELKVFYKTAPYARLMISGKKRKFIIGKNENHSWFYKNKEIFIVMGRYRILKFNSKGKMLEDVIVKVGEIKADPSLKDDYLRDHGFSRPKGWYELSDIVIPTAAGIPLAKGFAVVRRYNYSTECKGFVKGDYFSDNLKYIGKIKVPCFRNIFKLVSLRKKETFKYANGFLFIVRETEDKVFLEKWEVAE